MALIWRTVEVTTQANSKNDGESDNRFHGDAMCNSESEFEWVAS